MKLCRYIKEKPTTSVGFNQLLADRTGLEPATSAVTGQHSNQLNYRSFFLDWGANIGGKFFYKQIFPRIFFIPIFTAS